MNSCRPYKSKYMRMAVGNHDAYAPSNVSLMAGDSLDIVNTIAPLAREGKVSDSVSGALTHQRLRHVGN